MKDTTLQGIGILVVMAIIVIFIWIMVPLSYNTLHDPCLGQCAKGSRECQKVCLTRGYCPGCE
jgi:hypothetical protein